MERHKKKKKSSTMSGHDCKTILISLHAKYFRKHYISKVHQLLFTCAKSRLGCDVFIIVIIMTTCHFHSVELFQRLMRTQFQIQNIHIYYKNLNGPYSIE